MNPIFDTHAHYFDKRFEAETEGGSHALLSSLLPDSVAHIINVGTNCENAKLAILSLLHHRHSGFVTGAFKA